jgi:hypothetical protein
MQRLTLAYSSHRPETLPAAGRLMAAHDLVILEEPREEGFHDMLEGRLSIEDYLLPTEQEYPIFARRSQALFRELHARGVRFVQCEPFMDRLIRIHEIFAEGGSPDDIDPTGELWPVYEAERAWTGRLMDFYRKSVTADFDTLVRSVIEFARMDAAKGRLRDGLRARAIAELAPTADRIHVEAGYIHFWLLRELRRLLPDAPLRVEYLGEEITRPLTGRRQSLGPGDVLTMLLTFRPGDDSERLRLLAAQSLVHVKIEQKEEMDAADGETPHTLDEIAAARLSRSLDYEQCRELYGRIRRLPTIEAARMARALHPQD